MTERYTRGIEMYESGLDRILRHTSRGFVILSASQGRDEEIENAAIEELRKQVQGIGASFMVLDGVWYEEATGKEYHEKALFVPYPGENWGTKEEFLDKMLKIAQTHNQAAIIWNDGEDNKLKLMYLTGEVVDFGEFHLDKLSQAYFEIAKDKHKGQKFVFKGVMVPRSMMDALAMKMRGYIVDGRFWFEVR